MARGEEQPKPEIPTLSGNEVETYVNVFEERLRALPADQQEIYRSGGTPEIKDLLEEMRLQGVPLPNMHYVLMKIREEQADKTE
jgi:hypothetical protein